MRKLCIALLVAVAVCSCQKKKEVSVNLVVKDKSYEEISFYLSKMDTALHLSAEGKAAVVLPVDEPQYAVMKYKWKEQAVYLEPGKGFTATWDMAPSGLSVSFEGEGAARNNFISGSELQTPVMGDFGLVEGEFLAKMDQYVADNYKVLESKNFDKAFTGKEKYRIRYAVYGILWQYARGRACSDAFYEKIKSLMVEEEWLLQLSFYSNFMQGAVEVLSNKGLNVQEVPAKDVVMNELNYTLANVKNPEIREYLVGMYSIGYVDSEGVEGSDEVKAIFDGTVKDPVVKEAFYRIYNEGTSITKGKKAHGFTYKDINGKDVSLSDFKGKYVYIDLWATWCGPCREELPYLHKLEKAFKGTNICFVSISTDQDKGKWETMIKEQKMGGIQLHTGGDEAFTNAFRVKGIPHFILIDKEGRIVEANMLRPSDDKTVEYLSMLAEPIE